MCVVLTTSMSPSHLPVEKPFQVCAAISEGCGPAVHVDRPRLIVGADVMLDRHQFLRIRVPILPDAEIQRTAVDVRARRAHGTALPAA